MKPIRLSPIAWACTPIFAVVIALTTTFTSPTAAAQAAEQSAAIEEIIVTSRRISESLQEVPIAVSAFTQEDIDRIAPRTLRDFNGLMPNVRIDMNTAGPSAGAITIRGLGYADIEKTQSPAVGVIVDGVYQGTNTGQLIDTFDVQQIEVNRGPQGVLYGKNTTGGSIVVNRIRPQFNEWGWAVSGQLGDYSEQQFKGRLNIPLIDDKLAVKVSTIYKERDGFYDNIATGCNECEGDIDYQATTIAALFEPTENFDALLTYDYINDRGDIPPMDPRYNGENEFKNESNINEGQSYDVDSFSLNMNWDVGFGTISSITAYVDAKDKVRQDFDGSDRFGYFVDITAPPAGGQPANPLVQLHTLRDQEYKQTSQELRFTSNIGDNISYTVGGFYWDTELDFAQGTNQILQLPAVALGSAPGQSCTVNIPGVGIVPLGVPSPNPDVGDVFCQLGPTYARHVASEDVESWAVFGSVNWDITDRIEVSAGVRYIEEDKDFSNAFALGETPPGRLDPLGDPILPPLTAVAGPPLSAVSDDDSWDDTVYKLTANWRITDMSMVYASYATGFRSGGFSIRATDPNRVTYDPEDVTSYEIGTKNDLWDGRVRLNVAAFYNELKDTQFSSILQQAAPPGTNTLILNSNKLENYGIEVETIVAVTDSISIIGNVGWQDVENQEDVQNCLDIPFNPSGTACNPVENPGIPPEGIPVQRDSGAGFLAPDWSWALTGVFDRDIGPGRFTASTTVKQTDDIFLAVNTFGEAVYQDGYTSVDARIAYELPLRERDMLLFQVTGKNLTDEEYLQQELYLGEGGGFQGWGPPRQWAFEVMWTH